MVINKKLEHVLEHTKGIKPFNYDNVFRDNNELKKQQGPFTIGFPFAGKKTSRILVKFS